MQQEPLADARYVRRLSHDTLQRAPSPRELRALVGMPVDRVAAHAVRRQEAMEQWLEEELYYYLLLDRFRPRSENVTALPTRLRRGRADVRQATAEILLSTGFSLRNPGTDTFVSVVLEQCLGMTVQERRNRRTLEAGKRMYDGEEVRLLGSVGASQADLVRIVLERPEFVRHLLDRHHRRLLQTPLVAGRRPTDAAQSWIDRVHADPGTFFSVLAEWLASPTYLAGCEAARLRSDRQFIRSLYHDLLGRTPDYEELRNLRNALQSMADPTPLRGVLVKLALDARGCELPEYDADAPGDFVERCFRRYLGRTPRQGERAAFVATLRDDPEAGPRHVVRAILTAPDYQYY